MTAKERLIRAGILPESAEETVHWFLLQGGGAEELETYVLEVEGNVPALQCKSHR